MHFNEDKADFENAPHLAAFLYSSLHRSEASEHLWAQTASRTPVTVAMWKIIHHSFSAGTLSAS
jgi:hypothetical protein